MAQLQLVIVTPEETTLDEKVDSVVVPLIDGEAGILPGHAPTIARLGPGELRAKNGSETSSFYVDGGFMQIVGDVVSVLTGRSIPTDQIDLVAAREALAEAESQPADQPELAELRQKAIDQAKAQIRLAEKS